MMVTLHPSLLVDKAPVGYAVLMRSWACCRPVAPEFPPSHLTVATSPSAARPRQNRNSRRRTSGRRWPGRDEPATAGLAGRRPLLLISGTGEASKGNWTERRCRDLTPPAQACLNTVSFQPGPPGLSPVVGRRPATRDRMVVFQRQRMRTAAGYCQA